MYYEIGEFTDGELSLQLGCSGMSSDLVFACGYSRGDPRHAEQREMLEELVKALDFYVDNCKASDKLRCIK